jgi:NADH pyrophosphatase NudC (nudix superfamily)
MKWVSKTQERLDIYVKGNYSIKLARNITSEIERILDYNKWPYQKYGCTYQMDFDDKERIIVGLRIDTKENETKYELVLRTNRSRNSVRFLNIKKRITELISNIEKNEGFDNYLQIEKIICKKCGKKTYYNSAHDKYYCNHCNKLKGDDEVLVTEKRLGD